LARSAALWLAAAWAFSLTTLGFFVVPMLFIYLPSPALAGAMAGHLFQAQTGVSCGCALLLLVCAWRESADARTKRWVAVVLLGLVCALAAEFWVSPHIIARDNLAFWHRLGSGLYLLQWLCAVVVFHRHAKRCNSSSAASA